MPERGFKNIKTGRLAELRGICGRTSSNIRNLLLHREIGFLPSRIKDNETKENAARLLDRAKLGYVVTLREQGLSTNTTRDLYESTSPDAHIGLESVLEKMEKWLDPNAELELPDKVVDTWSFVLATHVRLVNLKEFAYADLRDFDNLNTEDDFTPTYWYPNKAPEDWFNLFDKLEKAVGLVFDRKEEITTNNQLLPSGHFFALASERGLKY